MGNPAEYRVGMHAPEQVRPADGARYGAAPTESPSTAAIWGNRRARVVRQVCNEPGTAAGCAVGRRGWTT